MEQLGHSLVEQACEFRIGENCVVVAFAWQFSRQKVEFFETRGEDTHCCFAGFVYILQMLLLKRKGVVLRNDCTDESVETESKGFVCLVDSVGNDVPSGFNGASIRTLPKNHFMNFIS